MSPKHPSNGAAEIADLARLARLSPDGRESFAAHVERLLAHFAVLAECDTEGVEPSAYPIPIDPRTRDDVAEPALPRDDVLRNAPAQRGDCFLVPRVVEG